jgi:hypothetical protein
MRFEDLAARLVAVEAKLTTLTGATVNLNYATSIEELDARLSLVEITVDQLISVKTQEHIEFIVAAPAGDAPVDVEEVVALSPSAYHEEAAAIVTDVVTAQFEAELVENTEVADIISAAVMAVVKAHPEVVTDPVAITEAIMAAVADMPVPAPEVAQAAADAVAEVIATVTGEEVAPEVQQQVIEAVATPADTTLDAIEARLNVAEAKVDSLFGK